MHCGHFLPLACIFLAVCGPAEAVNLVPNPGFESYVSCPTGFSQLYQAAPWADPNTGTSDAYNACSPGGYPSVNVPANTFGSQAAHGGAPRRSRRPRRTPSSSGFRSPTLLVPQVESPAGTYLDDTVNWIKVSGTFVAAGGEDHIVIGNFHDDATTSVQPLPSAYPGINYYVDDVLVEVVGPGVDQGCCLPDGSCTLTTPGECQALGGTPLGAGTACAGPPCGPVPARQASWGSVKAGYR